MTAELDRLMRRGWLDGGAVRHQALGGDREAARRRRVSEQFPGELIAIPAGNVARRANDTDYRFRADSAQSISVPARQLARRLCWTTAMHRSTPPGHARDAPGYWHGERFVESWRDRRPSLAETEERLGLRCTDVAELPAVLAGSVARVMRGIDPVVDALVCPRTNEDEELAALVSHLRPSRTSGRLVSSATRSKPLCSDSRMRFVTGATHSPSARGGSRPHSGDERGRAATMSGTARSSPQGRTRPSSTGQRTTVSSLREVWC